MSCKLFEPYKVLLELSKSIWPAKCYPCGLTLLDKLFKAGVFLRNWKKYKFLQMFKRFKSFTHVIYLLLCLKRKFKTRFLKQDFVMKASPLWPHCLPGTELETERLRPWGYRLGDTLHNIIVISNDLCTLLTAHTI